MAIKRKDDCVDVLSKVLPAHEADVIALAKQQQQQQQRVQVEEGGGKSVAGKEINVVASLALLMGEAFEASGNRKNATLYFCIALRCDVHCSDVRNPVCGGNLVVC
jgi:hypothetical protein